MYMYIASIEQKYYGAHENLLLKIIGCNCTHRPNLTMPLVCRETYPNKMIRNRMAENIAKLIYNQKWKLFDDKLENEFRSMIKVKNWI